MPNLELAIGQSKYTINCDSGEEKKIIDLSKKLNERVNGLSLALRGADEKTILMLCALNCEADLDDVVNNQGIFKEENSQLEAPEVDHEEIDEEKINSMIEDRLTKHIEDTTQYISNLTNRIKNL
ncbi:MAG: cell division protein ZapA (FtsZ GTPase activity inhibitor) [Rickettsiales bacterium]|jgi:cell division protein ZapA (FtsZ GTPase activity inhibitor)